MDRVGLAAGIMTAFGEGTGLTSAAPPRRYLWTDAFAVCNYLALHRQTGAERWLEDARALIDQVHRVLGRHRPGDMRAGWISGLHEAEAVRHPTVGGLRIGKPLPERRPSEPPDPGLDWERDGQYYHYLTRWMHALDRAATALQDPELRRFGVELANASYQAFSWELAGNRRLYWKMSIDLKRPTVTSMGDHDALDGLIATAALAAHGDGADLASTVEGLAGMCGGRGWATHDPLGLGLLITDALFLAQPSIAPLVPDTLFPRVLRDAARSLDLFTIGRYMEAQAEDRLAFRELGLSLGLAAAERLDERRRAGELPGGEDASAALDRLLRHAGLRDRIESFWVDPANQAARGWSEHEDMNAVMLATSLLPDGYLA